MANYSEQLVTMQEQVSVDISAKVKNIAKYHSRCGEKVVKAKETEYQFQLGTTMGLNVLYLYAISLDGLFDEQYNKYPFDTLSIDELVVLVEYINQL